MTSSDEDDDYMSDDFLAKCLPTKQDVRPGLIHNRTQQRSHQILKKKTITDTINKHRFRPYKVVEAERREEGLSAALSCENKGFAMLQKMGYKPGSGIGKKSTGIVEPVSINLKSGRAGLGRDAALKQIALEKAAIRRRQILQHAQYSSIEDYRLRMTKKAADRQTEADLHKSQRICEQLDDEKGFSKPPEIWFWPKKVVPETDEESEKSALEKLCEEEEQEEEELEPEIDFEPSEKLAMLTLYLRQTYNYCLWCGTTFDNDKDLEDNCPGATRDDH